ncbi:MAG TPA: DUF3943 domain-containing protein, partial [Clostridia bacterium]
MSRKAICGIRCNNNSLSIKKSCSVLTIILLIAFSLPAFAEVGPDSHAISPFVGGYLFDGNRDLEHRPVYGLRPGYDFTKNWGVVAAAPVLPTTDPAAPAPEAQKPVLSWETGAGKSYIIPALEIIGFDFLLNRFNYHYIDKEVYGTTWSSIRDNLTGTWIVDTDPFSTNQFLHPYQGSIYYGSARSAGLNFWESLGYAFVGSFLWEIAGETGPPSINDQITT